MVVELVMSIFLTLLIPFIVPIFSVRSYEIDPDFFRKIKIKKLSYMFRGIGGKDSIYGDVCTYGVILPFFVLQVLGYVLTIIQLIVIPILFFVLNVDYLTIIVSGSIFCIYILSLIVVYFVCKEISKHSNGQN